MEACAKPFASKRPCGHSLLVGSVWETLFWKLWMKPVWKAHSWIALKKCLMWLWKQFCFSCPTILQELGHSLLVRSVRETLFGRFEWSLFEKLIPGSLWRSAWCDCESRFALAVILFCRSLDTLCWWGRFGKHFFGSFWMQPAWKLHFWIALKKCLMWLWKQFCFSCHTILQELGHSLLVGSVWETLFWKLWMKPVWKVHFWIALKKCLMWLWKPFWFSCHTILQELGHSLLVSPVRETLF